MAHADHPAVINSLQLALLGERGVAITTSAAKTGAKRISVSSYKELYALAPRTTHFILGISFIILS
jgi:hypothetical protein